MNKKNVNSKIKTLLIGIITIFVMGMIPFSPDEGMFPLSEIYDLNLNEKGLEIPIEEVYNPDGISIVDALVKVGGCTGSFVSPEGLIITNHHCSFGAVQRASTTENNYLENGFLAKTREEEISASGIRCRITVSYEDVSERVLNAAENVSDISERTEAINKEMLKIIEEEEEKDPTIKADVSEMFVGESYVLFRYKTINDVRLVYVPPRSIGEFGGESDNWIWPRHTGDFSFLRAYVAPDGSPAEYSEDNVPYNPKKYIEVNPEGVDEGDFIFILGYPGRTYKHRPSHFLEFQKRFQLPYISKMFEWTINLYEKKAENNPEFALEISSTIKGLANVMKNYKGKLQGINRLDLVEDKQREEKRLQAYIEEHPELNEKYGKVLSEIDEVYQEIFDLGRIPLVFSRLSRQINVYRLGEIFFEYNKQMQLPNDERDNLFKDENKDRLIGWIERIYSGFYPELDEALFTKILKDAASFPEFEQVPVINNFNKTMNPENAVDVFVRNIYENSIVTNKDEYIELFKIPFEEAITIDDPLINFVMEIEDYEKELNDLEKVRDGKLNILLAKLMDVKRSFMKTNFVPDANGTLRLTFGYIEGYSPRDAVYYSPITTLKGVVEKGQETGEYKLPEKIRELYNQKDFGRFEDEELNDVPVGILYNTDTSGGNSGSPILDAYGKLIGVNFDRAYEATINDFTWSEDYSRSIGVDIRYVLWISQKVGGADFLLEEMEIEL